MLNSMAVGHWPVPPGDSPGGTGSAPGGNKDGPFERSRFDLPDGESPTGTGESPVLPIFRTRSNLRVGAPVRFRLLPPLLRFSLKSEDPASAAPEDVHDLATDHGSVKGGDMDP